MKNKRNIKFWIQAAVIGAVYAGLTIVLSAFSYSLMQVRVSEALTVLPALTPAAVPGLFVGCMLANIISPVGMADMILGSAATLAAAFISYKLRKTDMLVPLAPVIVNAVVIGAMLHYVYVPDTPLLICMGWVAAGQFISCYVIGLPVLKVLKKYEGVFSCDKEK